jgi:hypothetical protein
MIPKSGNRFSDRIMLKLKAAQARAAKPDDPREMSVSAQEVANDDLGFRDRPGQLIHGVGETAAI